MDYILVVVGLVALFVGGEVLVRGSVGLARRLNLSSMLIGLTVVGFGTSTPELLVSADAALRGTPDIAVGNVIGSNIANILLILGVTALVSPISVGATTVWRDVAAMLLAGCALGPLFAFGEVGRAAGLLLVGGLVVYLVVAFKSGDGAGEQQDAPAVPAVWSSVGFVLIGLVALIGGARALVDGSVSIARVFGLSESFIGLTVVAVGTSLPELATSLVAAMRRQSDIAIGNVVGSNIFNVLGILGLVAMIAPIQVAPRFLWFDLPVALCASLGLGAVLLAKQTIGRLLGGLFVAGYVGYVVLASAR